MIDLFANLALGFGVAFSPMNLLFCLIGTVLGTLIGVLPGLGPVATISMLLPITFGLSPVASLIMLAGIYYGAQYGGSTSAILVNLPGETSSIITCLDGYQMARKGRAGAALAVAAIGSFIAGSIATLAISMAGPPMTALAIKFTAADYFSLMVVGLLGSVVLASGSVIKAIGMIAAGLLLGSVGTDINSGDLRYTFGIPQLVDGIGFVPIAMGMFGVAEIIANLEARVGTQRPNTEVSSLMLTRDDMRAAAPAILRGTAVGTVLGVLPGGGGVLSSFAAYSLEKQISKTPEAFGQGAIQGVAAPESANNAGAQTSFIPLLTLGIPSNAVMALMAGAMMIQGITPGPEVMVKQPQLFWGLIASMWIGNLMLLVINLPLIGIWVKLLKVPYRLLYPAVLLICAVGAFSVSNSVFEIAAMGAFGIVGYLLIKVGCEPTPLLLAFILGPMLEENLRRALQLSSGDPMTFVTRPISASLLAIAVVLVVLIALPSIRRRRELAFEE